ncbi:MAG: M1 family metallopeptidase [Phycisphaerales bacterium]
MNLSLLARVLSIGLLLVGIAQGQEEAPPTNPPPATPTTTRGTQSRREPPLNWPTHRLFDHQHLKIQVDIPDMEEAKFSATATLTAAAIAVERNVLELDARKTIKVTGVTINGHAAEFSQDLAAGKLRITLSPPAQPGVPLTAEIAYTAEKPGASGNGLNWLKTRAGRESWGALVYSQGEPDANSYWFPCHDFPNEKLTTEIIATVPADYLVVSNGRLLAHEVLPGVNGDSVGRGKWHWLQDKPHAAYLVTLVVGKFDVADLGGPDSARPGLPMSVYSYPGSKEDVEKIFANTPKMVKLFEEVFDEPYPWDKYDQVIVRNFRWGGMENTSATTLSDSAAIGRAGSNDDLISHELAHQWMGDLLTCKSWAHLWLNEGWATFCEALWNEKVNGEDGYFRTITESAASIIGRDRGSAPDATPMVSNRYSDPDDNFNKAANPYGKGALVLHMLRERLGDETFYKGVRLYVDRFKFSEVETDDFRKVMEEVSGQSLERFFWQWCYRPGIPRLNVDAMWDEATGKLKVRVEQTQKVDKLNPPFAFKLGINCDLPDGPKMVYMDIDTRVAEATFELPARPKMLDVNPRLTVLAETKLVGEYGPKPANEQGR